MSVYSRTVQQAAVYLGGLDEVAKYLRAPLADVVRWVRDEETPPRAMFLRLVDLVIDESSESASAVNAS